MLGQKFKKRKWAVVEFAITVSFAMPVTPVPGAPVSISLIEVTLGRKRGEAVSTKPPPTCGLADVVLKASGILEEKQFASIVWIERKNYPFKNHRVDAKPEHPCAYVKDLIRDQFTIPANCDMMLFAGSMEELKNVLPLPESCYNKARPTRVVVVLKLPNVEFKVPAPRS